MWSSSWLIWTDKTDFNKTDFEQYLFNEKAIIRVQQIAKNVQIAKTVFRDISSKCFSVFGFQRYFQRYFFSYFTVFQLFYSYFFSAILRYFTVFSDISSKKTVFI